MIAPEVREVVRVRAEDRCEYCSMPQRLFARLFHVEHVIARQHHGGDDLSNLALACDRCSFHKGPNLASVDPLSGNIVMLFHPRKEVWDDHFEMRSFVILGLTECGRATVELLRMNVVGRVKLRERSGLF